MNTIGHSESVKPAVSLKDGYNYPVLDRSMLMSMNTITDHTDHVKTTTRRFSTQRH